MGVVVDVVVVEIVVVVIVLKTAVGVNGDSFTVGTADARFILGSFLHHIIRGALWEP